MRTATAPTGAMRLRRPGTRDARPGWLAERLRSGGEGNG
jgi:hypothetical protein